MSFEFYIFKSHNNEYDQFPSDKNKELSKEFVQIKSEDMQFVVIYRALPLTYITFVQKTDNKGNCFGVRLIFNGVYCNDIQQVFNLFNETIRKYAVDSQDLFETGKNGKISITNEELYHFNSDIENLRQSFKQEIDAISHKFPSIDNTFEHNNTAEKALSLPDGNEMFIAAIRKYRQVIVTPNNIAELKRRKRIKFIKNSTIVIAVLVAIIVGGIVYMNLDKNKQFKDAKDKTKEFIEQGDIKTANSWYEKCLSMNPNDKSLPVFKQQIDSLIDIETNEKVKLLFEKAKDVAKFAAEKDPKYYKHAIEYCDSALKLQDTNSIIINFRDSIDNIYIKVKR